MLWIYIIIVLITAVCLIAFLIADDAIDDDHIVDTLIAVAIISVIWPVTLCIFLGSVIGNKIKVRRQRPTPEPKQETPETRNTSDNISDLFDDSNEGTVQKIINDDYGQ